MPNDAPAAAVQLSLKNIYRLLSMQDYPLPTPSVFPPNTWRGVTVVSFWHDMFRAGFPEDVPLDLFDTNEKRSRALSILLGGTGGTGFRKKLFTALSASLSPETLLKLTNAWMAFLKDGQYSAPALTQRLNAWLEKLESGVGAEAACAAHLAELMDKLRLTDDQTPILPLFLHGLVMAWLTLFALYISRRDDPAFNALRMNGAASPAAMYDRYILKTRSGKLEDITNRHCVLCIAPIPAESYVGHSALLGDAARRLQSHGKLLISGIGGCGKSEFVRQLLQLLVGAGCYERAAYVQYYGTLADSFRSAFPGLTARSASAVIEECRGRLEQHGAGRTLLLIDNMNQTPSEDAALAQLCAYGCDVLLTSRLVALEGFDTFPLPPLSAQDSQALFRLHLRRPQQGPDEALTQLCDSVQGHPLSLVLFAGLCRSKYWSVAKLNEQLKTSGFDGLSFVRNGLRASIPETFSAVFDCAALEPWARKLLRLIAMLPYIFYLPSDLTALAADITPDPDELCDDLQLLADRSWLTQSDQGYLMHPVIAETLRLIPVSCDDYPLLWQRWNAPDKGGSLSSTIRMEQPLIVEALRHTAVLNSDGFDVLIKAEQSMISASFTPEAVLLLRKHREYLDAHPHEDTEEVLYHVNSVFIGVMGDDMDKFRRHMTRLAELPLSGLEEWVYYPSLCNVIEFACGNMDKALVDRLYESVRPKNPACANMICYLNALCVKYRLSDRNLPKALETAQEAYALVEKTGAAQTINAAGCYTRYAYCLADLGRRAEAAPLLGRSLEVMRAHDYRETSPTMMLTRTAYALMLVSTGDKQRALNEYIALRTLYQQQYQTESSGYAQLLVNMAQLFQSMGKAAKAEPLIREAVATDEKIGTNKGIYARHLRTMAEIIGECGRDEEALGHLQRARVLLGEAFGEGSYDAAYCDALIAGHRHRLGEDVAAALDAALVILRRDLGEEHPFTKNVINIRQQIK